jgi:hypothetical protein
MQLEISKSGSKIMAKTGTLRKFSSSCLMLASWVGLSATAYANEFQLSFSVAAGATSIPITVPAYNTPVSVTCVQNTLGNRGVGEATVLRVNPPTALEWVGMDVANGGTPSIGFSSSAGAHIIYCDFAKLVDLQLASATQMQITNTDSATQTVVINFVY